VPVSAIQKLTKNAELNLDENEICKFDCEGFALREFSGRLNLCLTNNPIQWIPFELVPAISYFNRSSSAGSKLDPGGCFMQFMNVLVALEQNRDYFKNPRLILHLKSRSKNNIL
jgi:hypothetical protein